MTAKRYFFLKKTLKEELLNACNEILAMTNSQLEFVVCELSNVIDTVHGTSKIP